MTPSNQKAFTDSDKERLKEIMKVPKLLSWLYRPNRKLEALLARLEKAEKVIEKHSEYICDCNPVENWRKSKGEL